MYSSRSISKIVVAVVFILLATIAVVLRLRVRGAVKHGLGADDYVIAVALLVQCAVTAMTIFGAVAGGGGDSLKHLVLYPEEGKRYARVPTDLLPESSIELKTPQILFAGTLLFATTIALIKASTLLLYKRLFVTNRFRQACNIVFGLTAGWFLASIFGYFFSHKPVSFGWELPGHDTHQTINLPVFLLSLAAINMILDLVVICMPLFVIRKLHLDRRRKLAVAGMFLLGGFCVVASIVRLYYFVRLKDVPKGPVYTGIVASITIWSFIECCTSIVAACLPTLAPLFRGNRRLDSIIRSVRSMLSLRSNLSKSSSDGDGSSRNGRSDNNAWRELTANPNHENNIFRSNDLSPEDKRELMTNAHSIQVQKSFRSEVDGV
ncbi:MAG: hypothetical protein Q9221_002941 [Calogaya cf. arnoldii]